MCDHRTLTLACAAGKCEATAPDTLSPITFHLSRETESCPFGIKGRRIEDQGQYQPQISRVRHRSLRRFLRMDVMNFVKRFVPFVAAFAVGIFVASFFVDLRGPRLFRMDMNGRGRCRHQMNDYQRLKRENYMLRRQLEEDRLSMPHEMELPVPPPSMTYDPSTGRTSGNGSGNGSGDGFDHPHHHPRK